jgi:hypothetical protein
MSGFHEVRFPDNIPGAAGWVGGRETVFLVTAMTLYFLSIARTAGGDNRRARQAQALTRRPP